MTFKVTTTDRSMHALCPRAWKYSSQNVWNLEPVWPQTALYLGTGVHWALQKYYESAVNEGGVWRYKVHPVDAFEQWAQEQIAVLRQNVATADAEQRLYDTHLLGVGMLRGYYEYAQANDEFIVEEPWWAEIEFKLPLLDDRGDEVGGVELVGRIDGVGRLPDGRLVLIENKTFSNAPAIEYLILDDQTTTYHYAAVRLQLLDIADPLPDGKLRFPKGEIAYMLYNGLKKRLPKVPHALKSGELSKALNQDTTYEVYLQALHDTYDIQLKACGDAAYEKELASRRQAVTAQYNQDVLTYGKEEAARLAGPAVAEAKEAAVVMAAIATQQSWNAILASYQDILQALQARGNPFFVRHQIRRTEYELYMCQVKLYQQYLAMQRTIESEHYYPNPTRDCIWRCAFQGLCLAENQGADIQYMIKASFQKRPPKGAAYAQEEELPNVSE
jgi:hypothetical protein